ncbi:MAG: hypothetical protein M1816_001984 [Peltula sp. TS41687]|nr:MAG: hypothetical protein M1816_001984 [Peltula sp. TS41687]
MTESINSSTWLLTEHLRYTPLSLVDDIINSINALLYRAVSAVEAGLLNAPATSLGFKPLPAPRHQQRQRQPPVAEDNDAEELPVPTNGWSAEARLEIENGVHQLETLLEATVDKDFDKLEIYVLRNVLSVPDEIAGWVRLGHYENLDFSSPLPADADADAPTIESLTRQRRKLEETRKLQRALLRESKRNAALVAQLRALLPSSSSSSSSSSSTAHRLDAAEEETRLRQQQEASAPFDFLTAHPIAQALSFGSGSNDGGAGAGGDAENRRPLTTTTAFVTSQIPALRALVGLLRPKLDSLVAGSSSGQSGRDIKVKAEDERALYVEMQTRRHLTGTRGLELDEHGAVKSSNGGGDDEVGGGKRVVMESVRGLEEFVGVLREGGSSTRRKQEGTEDVVFGKVEEMQE